jgi:Flp pilus assembly protein TadG
VAELRLDWQVCARRGASATGAVGGLIEEALPMSLRFSGFGGLARFGGDRSGSVAFLFGFMVVVLAGFSALALDYGRTMAVKTKLQTAVDAAALAADPLGQQNDATIKQTVDAYFASNSSNTMGAVSVATSWRKIPNGINVQATAIVPTTFGHVLGFKSLPVNVSADALAGGGNVEIALALDNTFSMSGSKIATLKTAAAELVDQIFSISKPGTVKMGLVPFSNYVNVGLKYRGAGWLSVPNDYSQTTNQCYMNQKWKNCVVKTGTCSNDGVPYSCSWHECEPDGAPVQVCNDVTNTYTWNGCVGSRTPSDTQSVVSSASPVPGLLNYSCTNPLVRLTPDKAALQSEIAALNVTGETYIPAGLMWGWRVLSDQAPFADGAKSSGTPKTRKALVLMTDGSNTKSQYNETHEGSSPADANAAMTKLCNNIKSDGIMVYTVAFEVNDSQIKNLLTDCATSPTKFFDAANSSQLAQAFSAIAGSLQKVVLAK